MEDSLCTGCHCCGCLISVNSKSCRFASDKFYIFIIDKFIEHSHRIASAADTSHYHIRKSALFFKYLCSRFTAYDTLEIPYYCRERMWSHNRTEYIERIVNSVSPLSHTLVYCIFKCHSAALNRVYLSTEKLHTIYIESLTNSIFLTHVYLTFKVEKCCCRSCCNTMLACSCLCDNPCLSHLLCQKCLTEYIIYLVRTCMV